MRPSPAVGAGDWEERSEGSEGVGGGADDGAGGGLGGGEDERALEDEACEEAGALGWGEAEGGEEGEAAAERDAEEEDGEVRVAGAGVAEEGHLHQGGEEGGMEGQRLSWEGRRSVGSLGSCSGSWSVLNEW